MSEEKQPATPVPAATVLLLRQRTAMEVFMVVRHHQIDFASGALVFPGGKADDADFDERLLDRLDGAADDRDLRAVQVASIRESFEECGVLLAREAGSTSLIGAASLKALEPYRERLNNGELSISEFVERENLRLACDQLHHFAHWVTPPMMPKRFDTHFFLAYAPEDQVALHDGYESVDSIWITPQDAITDAAAGRRTVIFPTLRNLEKLAESETPTAAIEAAAATPVVTVLPVTEQRADGTYLTIPKEAGYPIFEEKMPERPRG